MSKALLQQHAAKALKERAEQQQKMLADQQARNDQAISQANTENRSLRVEVERLRDELEQREIGDAPAPAYEDIHCAGADNE